MNETHTSGHRQSGPQNLRMWYFAWRRSVVSFLDCSRRPSFLQRCHSRLFLPPFLLPFNLRHLFQLPCRLTLRLSNRREFQPIQQTFIPSTMHPTSSPTKPTSSPSSLSPSVSPSPCDDGTVNAPLCGFKSSVGIFFLGEQRRDHQ